MHSTGGNDLAAFLDNVIEAIVDGFLVEGDVLVLDNATIHTGKANDAMVDWLWERHGIFVAFLPTWSPELNPIELVWNYLVQKLRSYPLEGRMPRRMQRKIF